MKKILCLSLLLLNSFLGCALAQEEEASTEFSLTTTAFLDAGAMPVLYTCDGKDLSPQLDWTNTPPKAQALAILVTDPDAPSGNFYHWVVYNIPKNVATLAEGISKLPSGALVGKNDFGKTQYNGPCPPKGSAHKYIYTLYALDSKLDLPSGADGKTVAAAIQKHVIGKAELTGYYSRWLQ